jgi:hypothetical protein
MSPAARGSTQNERDLELAKRANAFGANYSLRIILEARRAGIPISLGFALIEQESNFSNVFGHDPGNHSGAGRVTKSKYEAYRARRGPTGRGGMQGVGPAQLTYYTVQDAADTLGGCWVPKHNIRVAFELLANLIAQHGEEQGLARYNGTGPAAQRYSRKVLERQAKWHRRLT